MNSGGGRVALLVVTLAAVVASGGCAAKKDTRYLESRQLDPLEVPAGLDTPAHTTMMEIPEPARRAGAQEAEIGVELELPPRRIERP